MSKRGAATKDNSSKRSKSKDIFSDDSTFEMAKTMTLNRFPALVTLTAFLAFALLFVYSQGGHERVLRSVVTLLSWCCTAEFEQFMTANLSEKNREGKYALLVSRSLGAGWNLKEVDFLAEEIPKEVVDYVKSKVSYWASQQLVG